MHPRSLEGRIARLAALALFFLLVGSFFSPAQAQPSAAFTQFVIFGDSLCDVGNDANVTFADYGTRYPGSDFNYADGRFTNGTATTPASTRYAGVWQDQLAQMFALPPATASLDGGTDYAFGGATSAGGTNSLAAEGGFTITIDNMGKQVTDYLGNHVTDPRALYIVCGGLNDLLNDDSAASVTGTAQRVSALVEQLGLAGARAILVPNIPPLGSAPGQNGNAQTAAALNQAASSYRTQLNADLDSTQAYFNAKGLSVKIYRLDLFALFGQLSQNPAAYGFVNLTQSAQGQAVNADQYLFWDDLHPTTAGHYQIAQGADEVLNPTRTRLLWNHSPDGQASLWAVNADGTFASVQYGPFSGWTAKATAAAPDGTNWLLWTHQPDNQVSLWHVTALTPSGYTATQYGPYAGYTAVSLSVGGDGSPHILWNKTDGTALLWTVSPTNGTFTYTSYGPYAGWTANQVTSGQTVTDLLWTKTDGTASGYRIAANGSLTYHTFGPYSGYTAKSLSVGPDDGAHLLWDNTNGTALLWNVDFTSGAFTYTSYGPFSGYAARAIATGPDNVTHILWDATNGTASLWNVTGSGYTYNTYGPYSGWTAVGVSAGP